MTQLAADYIRLACIKNSKKIKEDDITFCVAIRAAQINIWVMERLNFLLSFYSPKPKYIIVDFGSDQPYSDQLKEVCKKNNADYIYVDDKGVFSAAKARNIAGRAVKTPLIFFSDVDFAYQKDIFYTLAKIASGLDISNNIRQVLPMPIAHLGKAWTKKFESLENQEKEKFIIELSSLATGESFGNGFDFVAPYSNAFLITKDFFNLSGGFCDDFRGHGSEDFEYLIRIARLSTNLPIPENLSGDFYGPLKESFWQHGNYVGFRRYLELFTTPGEMLGLKAFHLWHEKPADKGYWTAQNDWKRDRFNKLLADHYSSPKDILNLDFHQREKRALCLFSDSEHWGYFLPLRLYGYNLSIFDGKKEDELYDILRSIEKREFDRVIIFNPYMKSHAKFRGIYELAKKLNIKTTVIERGGLANTIYYADDVAYADSDFKNIEDIIARYSPQNIDSTNELINLTKTGQLTLESMDDYETTWNRNTLLRHDRRKKILIPLQLHDDMAVTFHTEGFQPYVEFYESIVANAASFTDCVFLIKIHPLSKEKFITDQENIITVNNNDNIHALIDISDAVIVYNSGVGLLSLLHDKLTFNIGNSYYTTPSHLSNQTKNLHDAIEMVRTNQGHTPDKDFVQLFINWLFHKKYSVFYAESSIKEFSERRAHAYKNIFVERIILDGVSKYCGTGASLYKFSEKSYLGWRVAISSQTSNDSPKKTSPPLAPPIKKSAKASPPSPIKAAPPTGNSSLIIKSNHPARIFFEAFLPQKKLKKLKENPERFFSDSKSMLSRHFSKYYIRPNQS